MLTLIEQHSKALAKLITHLQNGKNDTIAPIVFLTINCLQSLLAISLCVELFNTVEMKLS